MSSRSLRRRKWNSCLRRWKGTRRTCITSVASSFSSTGCITSRFISATNCGCAFRSRWFGCDRHKRLTKVLADPIYRIGDGVVVFARDCHMGWGNVVIVRHAYREGGAIKNIDSLYGHLDSILVQRGQRVVRGQEIATMGTAHGLYDAHLHLEIRKNITIGMSRDAFARDFSNYYDPSQFILSHRNLQTGARTYRVAMNTFTRDGAVRWDKARNYS